MAYEHIAIRHDNGDGTISVRLYKFVTGSASAESFTPLPGWNRQDISSSALTASTVCEYGHTSGLGDNPLVYPCIRWGFAGFSDPQVYFRDHTPSQWPVNASVADWNRTVGIDSYWIWQTTACPSPSTGKHCVNVYAGPYGSGELAAWTDYSYDDRSNRFIDGTVSIHFNTSKPQGDANMHRSTVCEELGHALGVGHNTAQNEASCMNESNGTTVPPNDLSPGTNDRGLLTNVVYPD